MKSLPTLTIYVTCQERIGYYEEYKRTNCKMFNSEPCSNVYEITSWGKNCYDREQHFAADTKAAMAELKKEIEIQLGREL